jgi:geranylgeranyl pyrophosphate synthase
MMNGELFDLDTFFQTTKDDLEKKIVTTISDKKIVALLKGGKRLRPMLAHLSFKVCTKGKENQSEYQKALEGAVSIELAHSASLVHDDIIDRDIERRMKPAFYVRVGVDDAILTGHKMLAFGFNIAMKHGEEIAKLYVDTWNDILNGEMEEVDFNKKDIKNLEEIFTKSKIFDTYNKIIEQKTAALFSSACKAGAIEANMSGDILKVFADYGREIGLAYQLADDLVDLAKGEILDSVIIPILIRLDDDTIDDNFFKEKRIRKYFKKNSPKIKELFIEEIKRHVKNAEELSRSEIIPQSPYKDLLKEAPAYIINKMLKEIGMRI